MFVVGRLSIAGGVVYFAFEFQRYVSSQSSHQNSMTLAYVERYQRLANSRVAVLQALCLGEPDDLDPGIESFRGSCPPASHLKAFASYFDCAEVCMRTEIYNATLLKECVCEDASFLAELLPLLYEGSYSDTIGSGVHRLAIEQC